MGEDIWRQRIPMMWYFKAWIRFLNYLEDNYAQASPRSLSSALMKKFGVNQEKEINSRVADVLKHLDLKQSELSSVGEVHSEKDTSTEDDVKCEDDIPAIPVFKNNESESSEGSESVYIVKENSIQSESVPELPQINPDSVVPQSSNFSGNTQLCEICYEDRDPSEMYSLNCLHRYCRECLNHHISVRINSGWLIAIPCMHPACSETILDNDVRALTDDEDYKKYKRFQELAELNAQPTCRWCPKPDCNTAVIADPLHPEFPCIVCTKEDCQTKFCYECSREWHPNLTCKENEKLNKTSKERKSDKWRKNHKVRKCAQCGMDIQKDSGCNHMKCTTCGYEFCWICMEQFTPDHYINGSCAGLQFTAHPTAKKRLRKLKRLVIGTLIVIIAIPIVIIVAGVVVIVLIISVPIYLAYRLIKYLRRKRKSKK